MVCYGVGVVVGGGGVPVVGGFVVGRHSAG